MSIKRMTLGQSKRRMAADYWHQDHDGSVVVHAIAYGHRAIQEPSKIQDYVEDQREHMANGEDPENDATWVRIAEEMLAYATENNLV